MPTRRFELVDDKSAKFWEISQDGAEYTVCFGKIGTKGQTKTKSLNSTDAALKEVTSAIKEKRKKGYQEILSPEEKQGNDKIKRDIAEIESACEHDDLIHVLLLLRTKGVERLVVKESLYSDDGGITDVIAVCDGNRYPFDLGINISDVERFFRFDINCNLNGTIAIADFNLVTGKAYYYNHWVDSSELRIAEFLYYCDLFEIKRIECDLMVENDNFVEGFTVEFDRFLLIKKNNKMAMIDKNSSIENSRSKMRIRRKWDMIPDEDDFNEYSLFKFVLLRRGEFNITPEINMKSIEVITNEIDYLFEKIGAISEVGDKVDDGGLYCKRIVNACGNLIRLDIDVNNRVLRYSGEYGEVIQQINPELSFKRRDLKVDKVEFGSDKLLDPRCLSWGFEID